MYRLNIFNIFLIVSLFIAIEGNETSCETSQKLFADLCFTPKPNNDVDFSEFTDGEPEPEKTVFFVHIGNDVEQLHTSELLKGELQSPKDDFSGMCYRFTIEHGENATGDGKLAGYGNLTSGWTCRPSLDFPGAEICDFRSTLTKYHEDNLQYISYVDNKTGFIIYISCYPNGQVGWGTLSQSSKLTQMEHEFALSYAEKLGFPKDTTAVLYGPECPE